MNTLDILDTMTTRLKDELERFEKGEMTLGMKVESQDRMLYIVIDAVKAIGANLVALEHGN